MVDDSQDVRRISWGEFFDFTHIFKSFMMVRRCFWQIFLALAAIVLVHFVGMLMDGVWSLSGRNAQPQDVVLYYQAANKAEFNHLLDARYKATDKQLAVWLAASEHFEMLDPFMELYSENGGKRQNPLYKAMRQVLTSSDEEKPTIRPDAAEGDSAKSKSSKTQAVADGAKRVKRQMADLLAGDDQVLRSRGEMWHKYTANINGVMDRGEDVLRQANGIAREQIDKIEDKAKRKEAIWQLKADYNIGRRALWGVQVKYIDARRDLVFGHGIFNVFMNFQRDCFGRSVAAVRRGQIFTGFGRVIRHQRGISPAHVEAAPSFGMDFYNSELESEPVGLLGWIFLMTQGGLWMAGNYPLYAAIFVVCSLSIWALFGGAIARIAAVFAAREESVSIMAALRFARSRFFSFLLAPLVPLLLILFCGVLMGLGGLLATLPLGDVAVGLLFVLPIILGCVISFLSIGFVVGMPMMFPTIAVEGSDSFDAISRSLHYSFTRPWRYALYSLVAAVYGAICYLFVRLFVFIALIATHFFVANGFFGAGASTNPAPELGEGAGKMDLLWTKPTLDNLLGSMNTAAMGFTETIASFFIHMWVYLLAGIVAAFVLCMMVNSHTQIYYLLRRRVDAADLDDVHLEGDSTDPLDSLADVAVVADADDDTNAAAGNPAEPQSQSDKTESDEQANSSEEENGEDEGEKA